MQLKDMSWPAVAALSQDTPCVIPIAAIEQHGRHLPLYTDSYLCGEVIRRAAERLADRVLFAPLMWLGNSHHHLDFAGTLSVDPRTYLDLLVGMAENLLHSGFRRIIFINGHGGNTVPAQQAIYELRQKQRQRDDLLLLFATYWSLGAKPQQMDSRFAQAQMGHACEWETSMMLRIAPELVTDFDQLEAVEFGNPFEPAVRAWVTQDRTTPGHIGDPRQASAEKGEILCRAFAADVVSLLERVLAWQSPSWNG